MEAMKLSIRTPRMRSTGFGAPSHITPAASCYRIYATRKPAYPLPCRMLCGRIARTPCPRAGLFILQIQSPNPVRKLVKITLLLLPKNKENLRESRSVFGQRHHY